MLDLPLRSVTPFSSGNISDLNRVFGNSSVSSSTIGGMNMTQTERLAFMGTPQVQQQNYRQPQAAPTAPAAPVLQTAQPVRPVQQNYQQGYQPGAQQPYQNFGTQPQYRQPAAQPQQSFAQPPVTVQQTPPAVVETRPVPQLLKPVKKGSKTALGLQSGSETIKACLGWNIKDSRCDVDASAFLLDGSGKVISDDWFVFYGQTQSPDGSVSYITEDPVYRRYFTIDLQKLDRRIEKIAFVLTIDEALEKDLNFGMMKDVYLRITDSNNNELLSFLLTDYYSNITSMMPGELYLNKGQWKFSAIGNGISADLAGLCAFYGVETE